MKPIWFRLRAYSYVVNISRDPMLWFVYENILINLTLLKLQPLMFSILDNEAIAMCPTLLSGGYPEEYVVNLTLPRSKFAVCNCFNVKLITSECGGFITSAQRIITDDNCSTTFARLHVVNMFSLKTKLKLHLGRVLPLLSPTFVQSSHKFHYSIDVSTSVNAPAFVFRSSTFLTTFGELFLRSLGSYIHSYVPLAA
ncbi:MAG: hypothetical protein ACKERF_01245 [Candidatus Hodgkinia cicadicola]